MDNSKKPDLGAELLMAYMLSNNLEEIEIKEPKEKNDTKVKLLFGYEIKNGETYLKIKLQKG